jgi:hypothetical protein
VNRNQNLCVVGVSPGLALSRPPVYGSYKWISSHSLRIHEHGESEVRTSLVWVPTKWAPTVQRVRDTSGGEHVNVGEILDLMSAARGANGDNSRTNFILQDQSRCMKHWQKERLTSMHNIIVSSLIICSASVRLLQELDTRHKTRCRFIPIAGCRQPGWQGCRWQP